MEELIKGMLQRLKSIREEMGKTQKEFAALLGVTQTYYSQVECGVIPLRYELLEKLSHYIYDIDYIMIGVQRDKKDNYLTELLEKCEPGETKKLCSVMIRTFYDVWEWNLEDHREKSVYSELSTVNLLIVSDISFNQMFRYLRVTNKMSQQKLADELGIGRTKCGRYEYGFQQPDARSMLYLYKKGWCLPSLFLEKYKGIGGIDSLLQTNEKARNNFYAHLDEIMTSFVKIYKN